LVGNRFDYNDHKRTEPDYKGFYAYIQENKDELFIADTFTFQRAYKYDVFCPYSEGSLDNYVAVGSWFVNSPLTKAITESYGYENPYDALKEADERVVLCDNMYPENKLLFIKDHYDEDRELEYIDNRSGIDLYRIRQGRLE
ncbi:MAG: hypothetical protein K6B28_00360, partial [Lachnospiraceae bacterium]|nr:hypothetical protein [Lachnospiraceae bacterium]